MSNSSMRLESICHAFRPATGEVIRLVDELLEFSREQDLQLDWQAERCRVGAIESEPDEFIEVPLAKSVFRAILARLAALCNERNPGSVSPYGGDGELAVGVDPVTICRVEFTNTPGVQRVRLTRLPAVNGEAGRRSGKLGSIVGSGT